MKDKKSKSKVCLKCLNKKSLTFFDKNEDSSDGREPICKICYEGFKSGLWCEGEKKVCGESIGYTCPSCLRLEPCEDDE